MLMLRKLNYYSNSITKDEIIIDRIIERKIMMNNYLDKKLNEEKE